MNEIQKALMNIIAITTVIMVFASGTAIAKDCGNGIAPCECGDTIVSDWTFTGDLTCPADTHGLTIGADGITIDGAGYRMTGSETADACDFVGEADPGAGYCGIFNMGRDNVVIKNLEITNFCTGIGLQGSGKDPVVTNTIENCEFHDNGNATCSTGTGAHGIHLCYLSGCTIKENRIHHNTGTGEGCGDGGNGIFLYAGGKEFADNTIAGNEIYNNRKGGIFAKKGMHYATITENHVYGNGQGGIILRCMMSNYNLIEGNNASANFGDGIFIGGENNTIKNNIVTGNMAGFRINARDSVGDGDGIDMGRGRESNDNSLYSNTVCGNAGVDIDVSGKCVGNHGRDNTCQTTGNYNDDGAAGCSEKCEEEEAAAATVTAEAAETPTRTFASTDTFESAPGFTAVFAIAGTILIFLRMRDRKKV